MEKLTDQVDIFENDIDYYFQDFCDKYNVDDMSQETQNRFNGCMMYIGKHLFRNTDRLKHNPNINNQYDIEKLWQVLNIYIELCTIYSKEISINGFSKLTAIDYDTICNQWGNNLSSKGYEIYKKLMQENENSNSDLLSSGKNPVGIMARLNHVHNWSAQQVKQETQAKQAALSLDQLPVLSVKDVQKDVNCLSLADNTAQSVESVDK